MLVAADCIPLVHRLEQISTEQYLGTQAENVMEALRENKQVADKIERVRKDTRQKRKEMAIKMRNKQLEQMGMKVRFATTFRCYFYYASNIILKRV